MKFKIWYDDESDDIINKINTSLQEFGLVIRELDGGDGFIEYEIVGSFRKRINDYNN